jgi:hypothetical protein
MELRHLKLKWRYFGSVLIDAADGANRKMRPGAPGHGPSDLAANASLFQFGMVGSLSSDMLCTSDLDSPSI